MKKTSFRVYKKKLANGMYILVRPVHRLPEVSVQLWYNVGSKDEEDDERGMSHLIEHMLFKGTKKLSEIDIDFIAMKLSGHANAFTSNDYTSYVFKFPSNVWQHALTILADCMCNARFDPQMLNSELHAVIQELKLYKDEYQEVLIERLLAGIFPQHPYHHPIVGYKQDLLDLRRDDLHAFYKKHYHPKNATLVIVGDVSKDNAFELAQKHFAKIKSPAKYKKEQRSFMSDVYNVQMRVPREVENIEIFYSYVVPGFAEKMSHLFDMVGFLVGKGKSSRLYERLVLEEKLATVVDSFTYDLFEKSLFCIYVQPISEESVPRIEAILQESLVDLRKNLIEEWEFSRIKKRVQMAYFSLLEGVVWQAELIGSAFLATGDAQYLTSYMDRAREVRRTDVRKIFDTYVNTACQHKGIIMPANEREKKLLQKAQVESDASDAIILRKRTRKAPVEAVKFFHKVAEKKLPDFRYPISKSFTLDNGLEVIYHHTSSIPKVTIFLGFKADYTYESSELGGMSRLVSKLLLEGTKKYSARELHRYLESKGIYISTDSGVAGMEMLSSDLVDGLNILNDIVASPVFRSDSIEKVRRQTLIELQDYWDTPMAFIDDLAKKVVYDGHPYAKNRLGNKECIAQFTRRQIIDFYKQFVSPKEAFLVIVGDLQQYTEAKLKRIIDKSLGGWKGPHVPELLLPEIVYKKSKIVHHNINRDQVVLAFAAPSISRLDPDYDSLAVLDFILLGGGAVSSSRLYQLREQFGIFYTIGGSLLYGADRGPGMMLIKTIVSLDKVSQAEKLIKKTIKTMREYGVSQEELKIAIKALLTASVGLFEKNRSIAQTFLFLKKCGINLDLFDKRGSLLSILKVGNVNNVARNYCKETSLSTITVGRKRG